MPLDKMRNPDAFLALLDAVAPGKDLFANPYRVPGSTWRTSAATHDPRFVSTRTRMIAFVGVPAALLALGAILLVVNSFYMSAQLAADKRQSADELEAFQAMIKGQIAAIESAPVPTKSVHDACPTFNPTGAAIVFTAEKTGVVGLAADFSPSHATTWSTTSLLQKGLPTSPEKGPRHIVVRVLSGTKIAENGEGFAREHVRVFSAGSNEVVCDGLVEGSWTSSEPGAVSAERAMVKLALMDVCGREKAGSCDVLHAKDGVHVRQEQPAASASASAAPPPRSKGVRR
jgi:hypothetical protein